MPPPSGTSRCPSHVPSPSPCLPPGPTSGSYCPLTLKFSVIKILRKLHPQFFSQREKKKKEEKKKKKMNKKERKKPGRKERKEKKKALNSFGIGGSGGSLFPSGSPRAQPACPPAAPGSFPSAERGSPAAFISLYVFGGAGGGSGWGGRGC